jgi:hypothetical protein
MNKVRLAGGTLLAAVVKCREKVSPPDEINVRVRPVGCNFLNDIFYADHTCTLIIVRVWSLVFP